MKLHPLANINKKEKILTAKREEIIRLDADSAVTEILDYSQPARLIQSFPGQDLYFLMHKIGREDFIPILALASSDQWEYILDLSIWEADRIILSEMTRSLDLLFKSDPQRLLRWIVREKPDFFEYYLLKNMDIKIREHDDVPPSDEEYITFDDKFYFRFSRHPIKDSNSENSGFDGRSEPRESKRLILNMLELVAEMDISVFHSLLLETLNILPAETEEEQYRLKCIRLAEKGILPTHEAVGIYQIVPDKKIKTRVDWGKPVVEDGHLMPPQWPVILIQGNNIFARTLSLLEDSFAFNLQSEFAALVNKIISADRIKIREKEDLNKTVEKACSYLSIGIEVKERNNPVEVVQKYHLEDIFRIGAGETARLKLRIEKWYEKSFLRRSNLPLSFLKEKWMGIVGGLMLERPCYFDSFQNKVLFRNFETLKEIHEISREIDKIEETDRVVARISPEITEYPKSDINYETLLLTMWANNRIRSESSLDPIPTDDFKPFFTALFSGKRAGRIDQTKRDDFFEWIFQETGTTPQSFIQPITDVINAMLDNLETEYGSVKPEDIDPRFMSHFLLIP